MRLRIDQLDKHLERPLAPVYVLGGDEPLQIQEARDAIRAAALEQGFDERVMLSAETGFDWGTLRSYADSLSLFGDKRIIDLRLVSGYDVLYGKVKAFVQEQLFDRAVELEDPNTLRNMSEFI